MGKDTQKSNSVIRSFSSGGIVFKKQDDKVFWLVTLSSPSELYPKSVWRLPKGTIEKEETSEMAALRETAEEAGVEARIIKKVDAEKYFFTQEGKKIFKIATFYLMEWVKDLPEGFGFETSEISWLPYEEAYKKLTHSGEKQMLKKAYELLNA